MPSWVILIPLLLPIAAALAIFVLERFRPNFGLAWLMAILASTIDWGLLLVLRLRTPAPLQVADWLPFTVQMDDRLLLQVDGISWPLAFSLATLLMAVILTAPVRLGQKSYPIAWASNLFITAMGMVGVLSGNLITLLLVWSLIDFVELVVMLRTVNEPRLNTQVVVAFIVRVSGTIVALSAFIVGKNLDLTSEVSPFPQASILLLVAAGLRLGILPLNLPYRQEIQMRRGVGTLLRMASSATSLVLLARLNPTQLPTGWMNFLLFGTAIGTLYAASMWAGATNELNGRPYWVVATAGLAIACVINGSPISSLVWSTAMILYGSVLFLYSARARFSLALPILAALAMSGLPFTPTAYGWPGLLGDTFNLFDMAMILAVALLIVGLVRHAMAPGEALKNMQGWIQVAYPLGLVLLVGSGWLIAVIGPDGFFTAGRWPASLAAVLLAIGWIAAILYQRLLVHMKERLAWLDSLLRAIARWMVSFFSFRWLYSVLQDFMELLRRLVNSLSLILEGEGGVLWALVLLALLLTVLIPGTGH
ncbi:hypothetical protein LARV_01960 [Longilinea arvoryzae]|uniref:NADH:quinone oxidoreductase/Mrp antiporter membrane subunit domain-containing protein n=1 Tax=Longilinea arvoryzae TaxID=360412 RepID=A0A0S7BJ35_9CHLR|nr:hypothetical protein [Longilinea arvoryzae]GAP14194.1 hypothetical protein LARV_01960 [Longilinea arvoryzae]